MTLVRRDARPMELTPFRTWSPFTLVDEVNRLFEEAFSDLPRPTWPRPTSTRRTRP